MKYPVLLIILSLICLQSNAKVLLTGEVYGGKGYQFATQNFFDAKGNRYQVVVYDSAFVVDSLGSPVQIDAIGAKMTTAVLKFDSSGKYLNHFRINFVSNTASLDMKFGKNNDIYFSCFYPQTDSLLIYDSRKNLYQNIKANYNRRNSESKSVYAYVICKLNSSGIFLWHNLLFRETISSSGFYANGALNMCINNADEIRVLFPNVRLRSSNSPDTIGCMNAVGMKSIFQVSTQYPLFVFSSLGALLGVKEPFKNRFSNFQRDSIINYYDYSKEVRWVSDGKNNYAYLNMYFTSLDSFNSAPKVPISKGNLFMLLKINDVDSIEWLKVLYKGKENIGYASNLFCDLDVDTLNRKIFFNLIFSPLSYLSIFKNSLNNGSGNNFIFQFDFGGNLLQEDSFNVGTNLYLNSFDYVHRQRVSAGQINGADIKFQSFLPTTLWYKIFTGIIVFDENSNLVKSVYPIVSNANQLSSTISFNQTDYCSNIVNFLGQIYFCGWFLDSINFNCKNIYATSNDLNSVGYLKCDGFVISIPLPQNVYFFSCGKYTSPSGKYVWDTSGLYLDTIPSLNGCDSILLINLQIGSNTVQLDTIVKYQFICPSKKHIWSNSGNHLDTLRNAAGCDSILNIHLTVLSNRNTIDTNNCHPISSISKLYNLKTSGVYLDTIPNSLGGDSLLTINFNLLSTTSSIDTSFCNLIKSPSGRYIWIASGIYSDTLRNSKFCDSVITVKYVRTATSISLNYANCDSLVAPSGKFTYKNSGNYADTLSTKMGCDSIIFINYKNLQSNHSLFIKLCDSLVSPSGKYIYRNSGIYIDTIKNISGCDSILTLNLIKSTNQLSVSKSNDINCEFKSATLIATGALAYSWSPIFGLNNSNVSSPIAFPEISTVYTVRAIDSNNCTFLDSILLKVNVSDSLHTSTNVITPNDDGYNDCFSIQNIGDFKDLNFQVYNRWGDLVFQSNDPHCCWMGNSSNGKSLSEGVYLYILDGKSICNQITTLNGFITILQ